MPLSHPGLFVFVEFIDQMRTMFLSHSQCFWLTTYLQIHPDSQFWLPALDIAAFCFDIVLFFVHQVLGLVNEHLG